MVNSYTIVYNLCAPISNKFPHLIYNKILKCKKNKYDTYAVHSFITTTKIFLNQQKSTSKTNLFNSFSFFFKLLIIKKQYNAIIIFHNHVKIKNFY